MAKGFVNNLDREDMQDETFKIIAQLVISAIQSFRLKNSQQFHSDIDSIYILTWNRLSKEDQEVFEDVLSRTGEILFGESNTEEPDELLMSRVFDDLRGLFKKLTKALDEKGILLRIEADLDRLVAGG